MVTTIEVDNALCERLVQNVARGDGGACRELIAYLWPIWLGMVRSSRGMQSLVNLEDGVHDVVARLVEKFGQPEGRGLCLYAPWKARNSDKAFEDWLRIVTKNVIRDYLRERVGGSRQGSGEPGVKRLLNEFASARVLEELGVRPPLTLAQTARELIEFARGRLAAEQLAVLEAWLKGATFEEIAAERGTVEQEARQSLRSAVAVLRRYFLGTKSE
jgi:DNA-directed RNA polymerase specialized sigma24 family protein